ncbi:trafficking kinesin-binding protein 1-like isoform X2 [Stegodyphus dumicola]|uniref:trafficking kinesin-binding protein 1-like isoform X2 n=1 Tax=Stegodyphus dumicola TaxID=202533 RepID=UPI0015B13F64|nr:trafficking kinesin-binding protein 1-like isoform X2 [Stegodyphus dumicola]
MTEQPVTQFSNSSTLTGLILLTLLIDICCRADTAEVELVSLIEEHIPHYKLRADTLTEFCGYENEDWYIQTPVLSPGADIPLSPEVVEETLKYFVLCADRLSQMTKTYNDIDAVTRLLEEKERDLELAARIGQSLLDQNKDLRIRNDQLEQELATSTETITQLRHDLSVKNGLLQIYTQDLDTDSETGSPVKEKGFSVSWEVLNKKISCLQEENSQLRSEAFSRTADIENEEKKEMQLISDCVKQLTEANKQLSYLQEEIGKKTEDNIRQQEEITQLLSQIVDLQRKLRDVTADNECLASKLEIAEECQHELSEELIDMKEKYGELMAAFQEMQAEVKQAQRNRLPSANTWQNFGMYSPYINPDSLANELEQSLGRDSDGYSSDERPSHSRKVFDTVRYANHGFPTRNRFSSSRSHYTISGSTGRPGGLTSTCFSSLSQLSSLSSGFNDLASDSESAYAESYSTDDENPYTYVSGKTEKGRPNKLDVGLHTLSSGFGTCNDLSHELDKASGGSWPSNIKKSLYGRTVRRYQLPEKLQIIKPLEGSQTLHHWQRLATPHLGGIFEHRPGVKIKGETRLQDLDEKVSLGDFEEDDDYSNPGKSFMNTSSIYTITTSALRHSSDLTNVTPSYPTLQLCTRVTSQPPSTLNSPQQKTSSLLGSQSLAKLLTERGIHGMVPSAISPSSVSPTPTPAPSPEGSPPPTPLPFSAVRIPDLVGSASIAKGFHLLRKPRRSRSQPPPKRSTREASAGLNLDLMGRIQGIGLKTLLPFDDCALTKKTVSSETLSDSASRTVISRPATPAENKVCQATISLPKSKASTSQLNESRKKFISPETALDKPWGYVPPSVTIMKSPAAIGLSPTVAPPLSRMPNPVLQLNSLRNIRPNCSDVGTVGTLRTLRKGGYI